MGKQLVIVGTGHAHMTVLKHLNDFVSAGHSITAVSSSRYHYYSGMGPGMLSGIYQPDDIRFDMRKMVQTRGGTFVEDDVTRIDPVERKLFLGQGNPISYDLVSFNTGSYVPLEKGLARNGHVIPVKPIENLLTARANIIDALKTKNLNITVAGGGPTGVEVSGNLSRLVKEASGQAKITLVAGSRLLKNFTAAVRRKALTGLKRWAVRVIEENRLDSINNGDVKLSDGASIPSDFVFMATGVKPSPLFETSGMPTGADGGLLVNNYLQSVSHPEIFGGGDCISFAPKPLPKVGVYAVRQNPILLHNLSAALNGGALRSFEPQDSFLLAFNMGDGSAIVHWNSLVCSGKLGFKIKNYLDRKFMRTFQLSDG